MEKRKCQCCGGEVEGSVEFITLSVVCIGCCLRLNGDPCSEFGCRHSVSELYALQCCGMSPAELSSLNTCSLMTSPASDSQHQRRYLRGEIQALRNAKRKREFAAITGINLELIPTTFRGILAREYTYQISSSEPCFVLLRSLCSVLDRAVEIVETCEAAHPEGALEFCRVHKTGGPDEFISLKQNMREALRLVGKRILQWLPYSKRKELAYGPLCDIYEEYRNHDRDAIIKGWLSRTMSQQKVEAIMNEDWWRNESWVNEPEDQVVEYIKRFEQKRALRTSVLEEFLRKQDLTIPEDCIYCRNYINGDDRYDLDHIALEVEVKNRLEQSGCQVKEWTRRGIIETALHEWTTRSCERGKAVKIAWDMFLVHGEKAFSHWKNYDVPEEIDDDLFFHNLFDADVG